VLPAGLFLNYAVHLICFLILYLEEGRQGKRRGRRRRWR